MPDDDITKQAAAAKKAQDAARAAKRDEIAAGQDRITRLLEQSRRAVLAEVADTDWDRYYLPRLSNAIDRQLQRFRDAAQLGLTVDMSSAFDLGGDAVLDAAAAMGIELGLPDIPTSLLLAMQEKAGQRIAGLANFAKDQVDQQIGRVLIAGLPREEAIAAIGKSLTYGTREGYEPGGIFGSVNARARFITQQELGAVYAKAQDLRRDQVVAHAPDLQKVWVHDGHPFRPRPEHVAMHGQRRDQDEEFSNGLLFPRDPAGDIGDTAGCTCDTFLWRPEYGSVLEFIGPATGRMQEAA